MEQQGDIPDSDDPEFPALKISLQCLEFCRHNVIP